LVKFSLTKKLSLFDDEEIIAAMSYKANRNWTLPAPQLSLLTPNSCFTGTTTTGILNNEGDRLWVTYRFDTTGFTDSLHCNYYSKISGPIKTTTSISQNVAVRFGDEFPFMGDDPLTGFTATEMKLLVQKVSGDTKPTSTAWREIDVTDQLNLVNGYIPVSEITSQVFQISLEDYTGATIYNLGNYIDLPTLNEPNVLNFGDEYFFYGNLETDIQATIYEMKYLINLGQISVHFIVEPIVCYRFKSIHY